MALPNLENQNIQDTYQRVIQTDGTKVYDGTGSLLPIEFNENNVIISGTLTAQTYVVSESITSVSSGSTIFGNSLDDTHQITGSLNITGSLIASNLSGTSTGTNTGDQSLEHLAVPGSSVMFADITSSGVIKADEYILPFNKLFKAIDNSGAEQTIINNFMVGSITFGDDDSATVIDGYITTISSPHMQASGHISASGNIIAEKIIYIDHISQLGSSGITITGSLTASGNISSSGTSFNYFGGNVLLDQQKYILFDGGGSTTFGELKVQGGGESLLTPHTQSAIMAKGNLSITIGGDNPTSKWFDIRNGNNGAGYPLINTPILFAVDIDGHTTASGNISASGDITGNTLIGKIDGGKF